MADDLIFIGTSKQSLKSADDAATWTSEVFAAGSGNPASWAYSPSLGLYVRVFSGVSLLQTSTDAAVWTTRTVTGWGSQASMWKVIWVPEQAVFVVAGALGFIKSTDGVTWTYVSTARQLSTVSYSSTLGLFIIAGGNNGYSFLQTSPDLVTWTTRTSGWVDGSNPSAIGFSEWAPSLGKFCVAGTNYWSGGPRVSTSSDGITWATQASVAGGDSTHFPTALTWSPNLGLFLLSGMAGFLATSPDGVTWTRRTSPFTSTYHITIAQWVPSLGQFIIGSASPDYAATPQLAMSSDGVTWTIAPTAPAITQSGSVLQYNVMDVVTPVLPITDIGDAVVDPNAEWRLLIKDMGGLGSKFVATGANWHTLDINWAGGAVYAEPAAGAWRLVGFNASQWSPAYVPTGPDLNTGWKQISGARPISGQAKATGRINAMLWLARKEFTIATSATQDGLLEYNADNVSEIWLDGVALTLIPAMFSNSQSITIPMAMLTAGTHCLAIRTQNTYRDEEWRNQWGRNPTMTQAILIWERGPNAKLQVTVNATTKRYRQAANGTIQNDRPRFTMPPGGPYSVVVVQVPEDPIHNTGGTFYKMTTGPYVGWLLNKWTNESTLGNITASYLTEFDRGPGETLATFYRPAAHGVGASILYNDAGECHFTLLVDDPNILVPKPKQTHYAIEFTRRLTAPFGAAATNTITREAHGLQAGSVVEFLHLVGGAGLVEHQKYHVIAAGLTADNFQLSATAGGSAIDLTSDIVSGEFWVEVFAGLVWDFDATPTEVVFYGIDYLGLLRYTLDERFDPEREKLTAPAGSYYSDQFIHDIVNDQLTYATSQADSIVGFIDIGAIATMPAKIHIFSTLQSTLQFVIGLLDSHRAGTGKWTRLKVIKQAQQYSFVVIDAPGEKLSGMAIEYGQLAQGYRVVPFGSEWASRVNVTGKARSGVNLLYEADSSAVDQGQWGRIATAGAILDVIDRNDMRRRTLQAAVDASRFGKQISVGLKLGSFAPLEDYDLNDSVPIIINHGAVVTREYGNDDFNSMVTPGVENGGVGLGVMAAYWAILGLAWQTYDDGHWMTNLTLFPEGKRGIDPPYSTLCGLSTPDGYYPPNNSETTQNNSIAYYMRAGLAYPTVPTPNYAGRWHFPSLGSGGSPDIAGNNVGNELRLIVQGDGKLVIHPSKAGGTQTVTAYLYHQSGGEVIHETKTGVSGDTFTFDISSHDGANCVHIVKMYHNAPAIGQWGYGGSTWTNDPNPAIIPLTSAPVTPRSPINTGNGTPVDGVNTFNVDIYVDRTTGQTYTWNDNTQTWFPTGAAGPTITPPFVFTQVAAITVWNIVHSLNKFPSVMVVDSGGNLVHGDILYIDANNVRATFTAAFSGKAYLT